MKIRIETITPARATELLNRVNPQKQRRVNSGLVDSYAAAMRAGNWMLNPHGIVVSDTGELIDGQHRLHAIIASDMTIEMVVAQGVVDSTIDVIDRGSNRTVAQQITLRHGYKNGNLIAAVSRNIAVHAGMPLCHRFSVQNALCVLQEYGHEIGYVVEHRGTIPGLVRSPVLSAIAFAMKIPEYSKTVMEFYQSYATGENMKRGAPALALFKHVQKTFGRTSGTSPIVAARAAFVCLKYHVNGQSLEKVYTDSEGPLQFFQAKQKRECRLLMQQIGEYKK